MFEYGMLAAFCILLLAEQTYLQGNFILLHTVWNAKGFMNK